MLNCTFFGFLAHCERDGIVCFVVLVAFDTNGRKKVNSHDKQFFEMIGFHFLFTFLDGSGNGAILRTYFQSNRAILRTHFQSTKNNFTKFLFRNGFGSQSLGTVGTGC